MVAHADEMCVYIGSYDGSISNRYGDKRGIYVYGLSPDTGELRYASHNDAPTNPSYVAVSADRRHLYSVDEHPVGSEQRGALSAYAINPITSSLTFLNCSNK